MKREVAKYLLPALLLAMGCPPASNEGADTGGTTGASDAAGAAGDGGGTSSGGDGSVIASGDGSVTTSGDGSVTTVGDGGHATAGDGGGATTLDGSVATTGDGGTGPGPWTLVGFSSRTIADGGGLVEFRSIDPVSGASSIIKAEPEISWVASGSRAYAASAKRIHLVGGAREPGYRSYLFTIDAITGDLVASPAIELMKPAPADGGWAQDYNWSGGLGVRSDGTLVGLTWAESGDAGVEQVRSIDPATGSTALVGSAPGLDWVTVGGTGFDPVKDVFYAIGSSNSDSRSRLFTVDAKTGAVLASPLLDTEATGDGGSSPSFSSGLAVRSDGTLLGLLIDFGSDLQALAELRSIDPATGATTVIKKVTGLDFVMMDEIVLDRARDVLWLLGEFNHYSESRVVAIDAKTGEVLSSPTLDGTDGGTADGGWGPTWTGGLFIVR
ncbi:MAG: hypothetical protein QM765_37920 [Myxococcales bacterium]